MTKNSETHIDWKEEIAYIIRHDIAHVQASNSKYKNQLTAVVLIKYFTQLLADARKEVIGGLESRLEELAEIEHDQWWKWAKTLMEKETLSKERIERWLKDMVPYKDLPEEVKEYDRKWARKVLATLRKEGV